MRSIVAFALLIVVTGCGASGLKLQAQAAYGFRTLNDEAVAVIETVCEEKSEEAALDESVSTDEADANAAVILSTCREIEDIQHPLAEAHLTWVMTVSAVLAGKDGFSVEDLAPLGGAVVRLYHEMGPLARRLDITLPRVPAWLLSAVGLGGDAAAAEGDENP
jgi:hypothetical protein